MNHFLEAPVALFRPSPLKSERDIKTRLFPPNAAPIVSEGRIVFDNTMPEQSWHQFDLPAWERLGRPNPELSSFERSQPDRLPSLLMRQAG